MDSHLHTRDCKQTPDALQVRIRLLVDWMAGESDSDSQDYFEATETCNYYLDILKSHYQELYSEFLASERVRDYAQLM